MSKLLLEPHERRRFSAWCKLEAETTRILLAQMLKLPHGPLLANRRRQEATAYLLIASILDQIED